MKLTYSFVIILMAFVLRAQQLEIANIEIRGLEKTKVSLIKKIIKTKSNSLLDSTSIQSDILILKRLPLVSQASYEVFYSHANKYDVFFNIEENFTTIPQANFYTTNNDELAYRLGIYEFNLFGQGISFGGFYQKDIFDSYAINFRAPFLMSRKLGLAVNYQNWNTLEPVFFDNTTADYRYNNKSFELLGLYQLNFTNRIELGINYFKEDYEYISGATNPNVPLALVVNKVLYKFIYEYNDLNYDYYFVDGFRSVLNFQYVQSINEVQLPDFLIGWNDFLYFKRFGERGNWANRLRIGSATNDETPFAPFAVDNNLNIRGVGNLIDRGTAAIVLNTEYRYTLYQKNWFVIQGNAFVDAGTWRNPGGDFSDFSDSENLRIYPGCGLRFIHKNIFNAIFRIDYGYGITPSSTNGFVFGIGQYF